MTDFKKLTPDNWNEHDQTSRHFVKINGQTGIQHTPTGGGWAEMILRPQLHEIVPVEVVELFDVARGTLCYGFYFYPLYTVGSENLYQVMDAAVSHRCAQLSAPKRHKSFAKKIGWLVKQGAMSVNRKTQWDASRSLRNLSSHRTKQSIYDPTMAVSEVHLTVELINELFNEKMDDDKSL